jgi:hypothetical protein
VPPATVAGDPDWLSATSGRTIVAPMLIRSFMKKLLMTLAVVALVATSCGGGSDTTATTTTTTTTTTTAATTTTEATTTTAAAESTLASTGDPDVDAVTTAFTVAFDSTSSYDEKAQYIDDPSGLEDTVATYMATGESMGGVSVAVTNVAVNGDTADVTYDLLFNGNPVYPNQTGSAIRTADGWKVPRDVFCTLMAHARSACPAA